MNHGAIMDNQTNGKYIIIIGFITCMIGMIFLLIMTSSMPNPFLFLIIGMIFFIIGFFIMGTGGVIFNEKKSS